MKAKKQTRWKENMHRFCTDCKAGPETKQTPSEKTTNQGRKTSSFLYVNTKGTL
jgi:hypothetical protein